MFYKLPAPLYKARGGFNYSRASQEALHMAPSPHFKHLLGNQTRTNVPRKEKTSPVPTTQLPHSRRKNANLLSSPLRPFSSEPNRNWFFSLKKQFPISKTCLEESNCKRNRLYLIGAASVLELTRDKTWTAAEEIVNFTGLDVVGKAWDEQCIDPVPIPLGVVVIRIVCVEGHFTLSVPHLIHGFDLKVRNKAHNV